MSAPVLLQRFSLDGTLVGEGSLALQLTNPSAVGTPNYITGPIPGTKGLSLSNYAGLQVPFNAALNFDFTDTFSIGCWLTSSQPGSNNFGFGNYSNYKGMTLTFLYDGSSIQYNYSNVPNYVYSSTTLDYNKSSL